MKCWKDVYTNIFEIQKRLENIENESGYGKVMENEKCERVTGFCDLPSHFVRFKSFFGQHREIHCWFSTHLMTMTVR